jgi:hypothetical protein
MAPEGRLIEAVDAGRAGALGRTCHQERRRHDRQ